MGKPDWMKSKKQNDENEALDEAEKKVGGPRVAKPPQPAAPAAPAPTPVAAVPTPTPAAEPTPAPASPYLAEHTCVSGDNLSYISKQYYGTADHWRKIYEANKDIIKDPNTIRIGQVLKIPKL